MAICKDRMVEMRLEVNRLALVDICCCEHDPGIRKPILCGQIFSTVQTST